MGSVSVRFYAELNDLLSRPLRGGTFDVDLTGHPSVKDVVESLGVPHTEVDLILLNGESAGLHELVGDGDRMTIYPVFEALDIGTLTRVRPQPLRDLRFAADVHLGRLARYLRLAGLDTLYRNDWSDSELVENAVNEGRVVLTRDRGLLKRKAVTHGYLVRETAPRDQLQEVIDRFDLAASLVPFTRCAVCNGLLGAVEKAAVLELLPLRTSRRYRRFWRCGRCGRIYWRGGHFRSIERLVESCAKRRALPPPPSASTST
jgi:uncharacterized protein with PIN domain